MGNDTFILTEADPDAQATVADFTEEDTVQVYVPRGVSNPELTIETSGSDAILNADGQPIGTFIGAAGVLTLEQVSIFGSTATDTTTTETDAAEAVVTA